MFFISLSNLSLIIRAFLFNLDFSDKIDNINWEIFIEEATKGTLKQIFWIWYW